MKKPILYMFFLTGLFMIFFSACSYEKAYDYDLVPYIKLGQYKGIDVPPIDETVTKESLDENLLKLQFRNDYIIPSENLPDRAIQNGDIVNISCIAYNKDGEEVEDFSFGNEKILMGSGDHVADFESQLLGQKVGDEVSVIMDYPDDDKEDKYYGQKFTLKVKIITVKTFTYEELTPDVLNNVVGFFTIEEYYEAETKNVIEKRKKEREDKIHDTIIENAEILKTPQEEYDKYYNSFYDYYEKEAAQAGKTIEQHLQDNNTTRDELEKTAVEYANECIAEDLVINAIARAENITISNSEMNTAMKSKFESTEKDYYKNLRQFKKSVNKAELSQELLRIKVMDFVSKAAG